MSLAGRILAAVIALVVLTMGIGFLLYLSMTRAAADAEATKRAAAVATTFGRNPDLATLMAAGDPTGRIQRIAALVRGESEAAYVVVIDASGRRWSHPNPALIGQRVEEPVVALDGAVHTGIDNGSLGRSANARAPIRDAAGRVVGEVSVGILASQVSGQVSAQVPALLGYSAIALVAGVVGALALARVIKRVTFGLEPAAIAGLMQEREAMLHGIKEGFVAFDDAGRITVINDEARHLLGVAAGPGERLADIVPEGRLREILSGQVDDTDAVMVTDGHVLTFNRRPVSVGGRSIGAVVTIRDRTEADALLRQVDSIEAVAQALRAHQHEYSNRLHALAVLLEIGEVEEARAYAAELVGDVAGADTEVLATIQVPLVASLLIAKTTVGRERGVQVVVDGDSRLPEAAGDVRSLLTILGNLLDNAIDAAAGGGAATPRVEVAVRTVDDSVEAVVRDNGPGIPEGAEQDIFTDGWSTKAPDGLLRRGVGLALVRRITALAGGELSVRNDAGAVFTVRLPMRVSEAAR
jgi:two-component system CitB family sensor kinase